MSQTIEKSATAIKEYSYLSIVFLLNAVKTKKSAVLLSLLIASLLFVIIYIANYDSNESEIINSISIFGSMRVLLILFLLSLPFSFLFVGMKNRMIQFFSYLLTSYTSRRKYLDPCLSSLPVKKAQAYLNLHKRATQLIRLSYMVLALILGVLVSAGVFVIYASEIAQRDTARVQTKTDLDSNIESIKDAIRSDELVVARLETDIAATQGTNNLLLTELKGLEELSAEAGEIREDIESNERSIETSRNTINILNESMRVDSTKMERLEQIITSYYIQGLLDNYEFKNASTSTIQIEEDNSKPSQSQNVLNVASSIDNSRENRLLITAWLTRFGILALSIYLVQILISMYRYNTKMAAHYRGAADYLLFEDVDMNLFREVTGILTPQEATIENPENLAKLFGENIGKLVDKIGMHTDKLGKIVTSKTRDDV